MRIIGRRGKSYNNSCVKNIFSYSSRSYSKEVSRSALRQGIDGPGSIGLGEARKLFSLLHVTKLGHFDNTGDIPQFAVPQIAFFGRTNAGKSTLISTLLANSLPKRQREGSKTPGSTRDIAFYSAGGSRASKFVLTDIPGYGYGSTPDQREMIVQFLSKSLNVLMAYILIDARVGLKSVDMQVAKLLDSNAIRWRLVGTKADRLKEVDRSTVLHELMNFSVTSHPHLQEQEVFLTSIKITKTKKVSGLDELEWSILRSCGISANEALRNPEFKRAKI
ncbi:P-loop containing nucleoside triphosphate hydrolase protein [Lipomyces arxii]|uniref:P-loop containing nucleoside triphosphate hydrolase protein n=1 Tax=Lipomyces arxii TaxID=56418 RepID=UPI0034CD74C4